MVRLYLLNFLLQLILKLGSLLDIALLLSEGDFQVQPLLQILSQLELSFGLLIHQLFHLLFSGIY